MYSDCKDKCCPRTRSLMKDGQNHISDQRKMKLLHTSGRIGILVRRDELVHGSAGAIVLQRGLLVHVLIDEGVAEEGAASRVGGVAASATTRVANSNSFGDGGS